MQILTLGPLDLKGSGSRDIGSVLAQPKRSALLAYLAVTYPPAFHRRDTLVALLWPELDQLRGRHALRNALHFLRSALGKGLVVTRGDEEVRVEEHDVWCDAPAFEHLLQSGNPAAALELYRADFLQGFHISGALDFERWVDGERARLRELAVEAAWRLTGSAERSGNAMEAARWARRAVRLSLEDEGSVRRFIETLDRLGDRAAALRAYEAFSRTLAEEYQVHPAPETEELVKRVRTRERQVWRGTTDSGLSSERRTSIAASTDTCLPAAGWDPTEHSAGQRVRRRGILGGLGALLLLFGIASGYVLLKPRRAAIVPVSDTTARLSGPPSDPLSPDRIAILPFAVRGNEDVAYLREGMVDLMSKALDGAGRLRAVDPHAMLSFLRHSEAVRSPEGAGRVARRFGAGLYVLGAVVAGGDRILVNAVLYDVEGHVIKRVRASIDDESRLFELVDDVSRQLLAAGVGGPGTRLSTTAGLTTQSLPALREYLRGENALRAGQFDSAVAAFERAVAADRTFALGFYRLAVAGTYGGGRLEVSDAIRAALRYKDRLGDRDRALIEAYNAFWLGTATEAERRLRSIVGTYPSDVEAWYCLSRLLLWSLGRGRSTSEVKSAVGRVLALDPDNVQAQYELSWIAAIEGRHGEARRLLERWVELAPHADNAPARRAGLAYARQDRREQERILAELREVRDFVVFFAVQDVSRVADNRQGAIEVATILTQRSRSAEWQAIGHSLTAHLLLAMGRWRAAKAELDRAEGLDGTPPWSALSTRATLAASSFLPVPRRELEELRSSIGRLDTMSTWNRLARPYLAGLLSVRLEDYEGAELHAKELERYVAPDSGLLSHQWAARARDWATSVRAHAAWRAGRPTQALALLDQANPEAWSREVRGAAALTELRAHERYLKGELLRELGRDREALVWYENLGWMAQEQIYLAPAHFRLGEIHERLGDPARAIRQYRRVIEVWSNCDAELRGVVNEAKQRLARLESAVR